MTGKSITSVFYGAMYKFEIVVHVFSNIVLFKQFQKSFILFVVFKSNQYFFKIRFLQDTFVLRWMHSLCRDVYKLFKRWGGFNSADVFQAF